MTDWLDRSECDFTLRGRFGESIGVPATSAPVTVGPIPSGDDLAEPAPARPEPPDEATRSEMRRALHRLSTNLRQSVEAQQRALADIGDLMEALR